MGPKIFALTPERSVSNAGEDETLRLLGILVPPKPGQSSRPAGAAGAGVPPPQQQQQQQQQQQHGGGGGGQMYPQQQQQQQAGMTQGYPSGHPHQGAPTYPSGVKPNVGPGQAPPPGRAR